MIPPKATLALIDALTIGDWKDIFRQDPALRDRVADANRELYYEELDARPIEPFPDMGAIVHDEGEEPDLGE